MKKENLKERILLKCSKKSEKNKEIMKESTMNGLGYEK